MSLECYIPKVILLYNKLDTMGYTVMGEVGLVLGGHKPLSLVIYTTAWSFLLKDLYFCYIYGHFA